MSQNKSESMVENYQSLDQKVTESLAKIDQLEIKLARITELLEASQAGKCTEIEQAIARQIAPVQSNLFKIKSINSLIARQNRHPNKPLIRVVFLVHNVECWDALHEVYTLMKQHPRFDPIVVTLPRDFLNQRQFSQEELNYNGLVELGITPIRFNDKDHANQLEMLKLMNPDIIFRQSPWDVSIPESFHFNEINFAKICYVAYGFSAIPFNDNQMNRYFMRSCWRAYCETEIQGKVWERFISNGSLKVSGSAKLDRILAMNKVAEWPINVQPDTTRIIWAPHHSFNEENWLNFSTFMDNYQQFLQLARECPELQIVLKPHPTMMQKLMALGLMTHEQIVSYLNEFTALPNTALVTGGNYIPLFWASDLMITDGIGFFGEYMVTGKPIIWTENPNHVAMNELVTSLTEGMYRAGNFDAVVGFLEQLLVKKEDPLKKRRKELIKTMMPRPNGSAQFIVNDVLAGMDEKSNAPNK